MRNPVTTMLSVSVLVAASLSSSCMAAEGLDELVKELIKDAKTDAERATRLYEAAEIAKENDQLCVGLLETGVGYGLKSVSNADVRKATEKSLDLLIEKVPERKNEWNSRKAELYRQWYQLRLDRPEKEEAGQKLVAVLLEVGGGDEQARKWADAAAAYREAQSVASSLRLPSRGEISQKSGRAEHFANAQQKVAGYLKVLENKPDATAARAALVKCLVVDLDDPWEAAKYLTKDVEETWRTNVILATQPVPKLTAEACRRLGEWYHRELAKDSDPFSKPMILMRAKGYYEGFIALHPDQDADYVVAKAALMQLEKALEGVGALGTAQTPAEVKVTAKDGVVLVEPEPGLDIRDLRTGTAMFTNRGYAFGRVGKPFDGMKYLACPGKGDLPIKLFMPANAEVYLLLLRPIERHFGILALDKEPWKRVPEAEITHPWSEGGGLFLYRGTFHRTTVMTVRCMSGGSSEVMLIAPAMAWKKH